MKVALVVPALNPDESMTPAVDTFISEMSEHVEMHVFPLYFPQNSTSYRHRCAVVHPVGGGRTRRVMYRALMGILCEHHRSAFDVLHGLWLFPSGLVVAIAARLLRTPSMASIGGSELINLSDIGFGGLHTLRGRITMGQVLSWVDLVTGGTEFVLNQARRVRPATMYIYAPLPVPLMVGTEVADRNRGLIAQYDPERPKLLHVAALYPLKDQETLLRAFAIIRDAIPGATLTIAGNDPFGHRSTLEALVSQLRLQESVAFLGYVPHAEIPRLYSESDLFVLTSRHESQGMVVLEAASFLLPTVGTPVGVIPALAPDAAIAVSVRDPKQLALEVVRLLKDPERLERVAANARKTVIDEYCVDRCIGRFMDCYRSLAGETLTT